MHGPARATTLAHRYVTPVVRPSVDRHRIIAGAGWMMELRQPPGDYGAPATSELLIVEALSPGVALRKRWGTARFEGVAPLNSLWLVPPGATIDLTIRASHTVRTLAIASPPAVGDADREPPTPLLERLATAPFLDAEVSGLLTQLWQASAPDPTSADRRLHVDHVMQRLLARLALLDGRPGARFRGGLTTRQVAAVTEMIAGAADGAATLAALSAVCGLSPFHFARAFKQTLGVSPYRYQKLLRLQRARDLLAGGRRTVLQVAVAVGYQSAQAMARVFRQELGVSPTEFQAARRN